MIIPYDTGSLPFDGDFQRFDKGASAAGSLASLLYSADHPENEPLRYFQERVIEGLVKKIEAGMEIANYPQFRDMNTMFLDLASGLEKTSLGYVESGKLVCKGTQIPEVEVIKQNSRRLHDRIGRPLHIKICVTGPYTLSSFFLHRDAEIFSRLGNVISTLVANNIFKDKYCTIDLVSIDEPTFGLLSDPLIDYGSDGREYLHNAWESIFYQASSQGVNSSIHLHNTSDGLFWDVKSLKIVESHVGDPIYYSSRTNELIERADKFLKASICTTDFSSLVERNIQSHMGKDTDTSIISEKIGEVWTDLNKGKRDPMDFLEDHQTMAQRLAGIVDRYGVERVLYAGPECGLRGFLTYECAIESLRRTSMAIRNYRTYS